MTLHAGNAEAHWRPRASHPSAEGTSSPDGPDLALLLAGASGRSGADLLPLTQASKLNWDALADLAESHHVVPLIQPALESLPAGVVPDAMRHRMRQLQHAHAARVLFLTSQLAAMGESFASEGIEWVPFKGPALAMQAYRGLLRRQSGDLDLLIRPTDVRRAKTLLMRQGHELMFPNCSDRESNYLRAMDEPTEARYLRQACEYHLWRERDRLNIDLHWRINPPEMRLALDEPAMFRRLRPDHLGGRAILQLHPADTMLMLCCNGVKDCWTRLDRICDVAELLRSHPDEDWSIAFESACRIGAHRVLLLGLELARRLLDAPIPQSIEVELSRESTTHAMTGEVRRGLVQSLDIPEMQWQLRAAWFHLRMRERWRDRMGYCAARLGPTVGDWTAVSLPRRWSFLYYLIRPARLAARACAAPLRMA